MASDPTMPKVMPPAVARAIAEVLGYRGQPTPVELYDAIREALKAQERPT